MKRLRILTFVSTSLALLIFFNKKRSPTTIASGEGLVLPKAWLQTNKQPITPPKEQRPGDQTFLTFPEWYLVFSPEEQAHYFKTHTATSFPFMAHTRQIWESYNIVKAQIKDNFPENDGYHFMIKVIGSSATAEYSIKTIYETLIGRLTDTRTPETAEDQFNAQFTQDYVNFIKDRPWYEFDFKNQLKKLWGTTPLFGAHFIRKIERRYILSSELMVKYAYGKLIGLGTKEMYEEALMNTAVILKDSSLINVPRYDKFNKAITNLALKGYNFREIAGNNSAILLTILAPSESHENYDDAKVIFTQVLASDPSMKRIALATPVKNLAPLLRIMSKNKTNIEHVFDY